MKNTKIKAIILSIAVFLVNAHTALAIEIKNPATDFLVSYEDNSFTGLLTFFVKALLGLVGLIAMLFIIIGGFQLITSRGDEEQATAGKRTLTNAIIGLVIVILSYLIVVVTINALNPAPPQP